MAPSSLHDLPRRSSTSPSPAPLPVLVQSAVSSATRLTRLEPHPCKQLWSMPRRSCRRPITRGPRAPSTTRRDGPCSTTSSSAAAIRQRVAVKKRKMMMLRTAAASAAASCWTTGGGGGGGFAMQRYAESGERRLDTSQDPVDSGGRPCSAHFYVQYFIHENVTRR